MFTSAVVYNFLSVFSLQVSNWFSNPFRPEDGLCDEASCHVILIIKQFGIDIEYYFLK